MSLQEKKLSTSIVSKDPINDITRTHYKKNDLLRRTYCGGYETGRYMSPIAAGFGPAAEHGSIAAG